MPLDPKEQAELERTITKALRDVSRPNPMRLKAALRVLVTTNLETFEKLTSETAKRELADIKEIWLHPEKIAPKSAGSEAGQNETRTFIRDFISNNLHLLEERTSILPNTFMVQKSIMEGAHLKAVVHASALKNIVAQAHFIDELEKRFKEQGLSEEQIAAKIARANEATQNLHKSVMEGNITGILRCLAVTGVDINSPNQQGLTPLHIATREGLTETTKLLLTVPGINVNAVNNNGWTPLHIAARMGHADIVDALLTLPSVNVNVVNSDGWTPLHWGAWHGFTEVVTVLLSAKGVHINAKDRYLTTPLHWAARNGHPDVISVLLSQPKIEVNPQDNESRTPLHFAVIYNHEDAVRVLIQTPHIEMNLEDMDGLTPLHWAARNGHVGITKALLSHRETRTVDEDHNFMTPIDWAVKNGNEEVVALLSPKPGLVTLKKKSLWEGLITFFKRKMTKASYY